MKKIICVLMSLCLTLASLPVAFGQQVQINIPISVKENNDIYVAEALYRRGFALPKGQVFSLDDFGLYDTEGNAQKAFFEVTEQYDDGSVKWALCSFVTELKKSERKEYAIRNSGKNKVQDPVSVTMNDTHAVIKNSKLTVDIAENGISITPVGGGAFFDKINGYITLDGCAESIMRIDEISTVKQNDLYVKLSAKGNFGGFARGELVITLSSGAEKADIEYRITARQDLQIYSTGIKILPNTQSVFSYPQTSYGKDNVVGSDYIYSDNGNRQMYFITRDNRRFRNATTSEHDTGFVFDADAVRLAPIVNKNAFLWFDGLTRTIHMTVSMEENGYEQIKTLDNEPTVTVDPRSFEQAGVIETAGSCAPIDRMINMVNYDVSRRDGRFDAGAIHYDIDPDAGSFSSSDMHPGEMEYHLGVAYMATADAGVFTVMCESAEFWADVEIYKGDKSEIYGANRYRTGPQYYNARFRTSHPYYGDSSGLYMAYVLSGDEYFRDIYKIAIEHILNNMNTCSKNNGYRYPHMYEWTGSVQPTPYVESRYMIQARPLYLAYGLFQDERFREAALEIVDWAYVSQSENGWWYQAYYDNGEPFRQAGQSQDAVKTYVWMYGARGISFLSRYEKSEKITTILKRVGDFVENEYANFGKGLWKPNGDVNLYAMDEDNTRGKGPYEDVMGMELLYCTYQLTGNEKYLKSLLECMETALSSMNPGGASVLLANMEGCGNNLVMGGGQNYTWLMLFPELRELFREKREVIESMGFGHLLTAFGDGAKMYEGNVERSEPIGPELTQIIFENGKDKVLFASNYGKDKNGNYSREYSTTIHEGGLWMGAENLLYKPGSVTLHQFMNQFDRMVAIYTPICITALSDNLTAYVDEYNEQKVVFRVYGEGEFQVELTNGKFAIIDGANYSVVTERADDNGVKVTVCASPLGKAKAERECLKLKVSIHNDVTLFDTDSVSAYAAVHLGLMSANNRKFNPSGAVDSQSFETAVASLTGVQKSFHGTTYGDAVHYVLEVLGEIDEELFAEWGIVKKSMTLVGTDISDEEAVKLGAAAIQLPQIEKLGGDILLPTESVAGTKITWKSQNESVLSDSGVFNAGTETDSVVLTATVTKGNAIETRDFQIAVMKGNEVGWYANTMVVRENKHLLKNMTGRFEINFSVIPGEDNTNAIIAFSNSGAVTELFSDLPIIVRFSPDGVIDAYNGSEYQAANMMEYHAGTRYDINVSVSLENKSYSVDVTPKGGNRTEIARNFSFRATAPEISSVDALYIPTAKSGSKLLHIDSIDCAESLKDETLVTELYDTTGLMYGKYAQNFIYAPNYYEGEKIHWIGLGKGETDANGKITLTSGVSELTIYGLKGADATVGNTEAEVLRKSGLIEQVRNENQAFCREQAAELLNALRYVMAAKSK